MTTAVQIHGTCDAGFSAVKEAFAANFEGGHDVGASLALTVEGRMVVDIWGGHAGPQLTKPWERDTIVNVYSTTKGMTTICAHRLVDAGLLDVDAPVTKYWPEFGQAGKEDIPVRYLLNHQAGLPAVNDPLPLGSMYDWDAMTEALAAQEPWWDPGTKHGYHAVTFGWLVGEVVRRISGKTLGTHFREEIAEPFGIDFHIGCGPELDERIAEMIPAPMPEPTSANPLAKVIADPTSMSFKAFGNPPDGMIPGAMNTRAWRAAEIPAANGHTNARALARIYGALATGGELDGARVLSRESIDRARQEQSYGTDAVLLMPTRWGLGFMLDLPEMQMSPTGALFGHAGLGGSLGFADPDAKIGFGYTMNKTILPEDLIDPRWGPMLEAVYGAVGK